MNAAKEFEEFRSAFRNAGFTTKVVLLLFFFLSISSITSLADKVVEWRGFILTALEFYQQYFVNFIARFAKSFGLSYSREEIDAAMLLSISVTLGMRLLSIGQLVAYRIINERYGSDQKPNLRMYWVIAVFFPIGVWGWYGLTDPVIYPYFVGAVFLFYPVFLVVPKYVMSKFGYEYFEKSKFSYFSGYYAYVLMLLFLLAVLAAINAGLE